jgi:hypothetical protein
MYLIVLTRRSSDSRASRNDEVFTCTANAFGGKYTQAEIFVGTKLAEEPTRFPAFSGTVYLDQPNDLRFELDLSGSVAFYFGADLLWKRFNDIPRAARLYMPSDWELNATAVSGGPVAVDIAEVDGTDIYICVDGERRMRFDTAAKILYAEELHVLESLVSLGSDELFKARYDEAVFFCFDPAKEDVYPYAEFTADGEMKWDGHIDLSLDQAGIEAL